MPQEKIITVYKFEELNDKAKQTAIEQICEFDSENDIGYFQDYLIAIGFENPDIRFSGFAFQGDGASFTATIDLAKLAKWNSGEIDTTKDFGSFCENVKLGFSKDDFETILSLENQPSAIIERGSSRYVHWNSWTTVSNNDDDKFDSIIEALQEAIEVIRKEICDKIYRSLEASYYAAYSEETANDLSDANDYLFYANGKLA